MNDSKACCARKLTSPECKQIAMSARTARCTSTAPLMIDVDKTRSAPATSPFCSRARAATIGSLMRALLFVFRDRELMQREPQLLRTARDRERVFAENRVVAHHAQQRRVSALHAGLLRALRLEERLEQVPFV